MVVDYFKELLGKTTIPTEKDGITLTIQDELDIKKGYFTIYELKKSIIVAYKTYTIEKLLA